MLPRHCKLTRISDVVDQAKRLVLGMVPTAQIADVGVELHHVWRVWAGRQRMPKQLVAGVRCSPSLCSGLQQHAGTCPSRQSLHGPAAQAVRVIASALIASNVTQAPRFQPAARTDEQQLPCHSALGALGDHSWSEHHGRHHAVDFLEQLDPMRHRDGISAQKLKKQAVGTPQQKQHPDLCTRRNSYLKSSALLNKRHEGVCQPLNIRI